MTLNKPLDQLDYRKELVPLGTKLGIPKANTIKKKDLIAKISEIRDGDKPAKIKADPPERKDPPKVIKTVENEDQAEIRIYEDMDKAILVRLHDDEKLDEVYMDGVRGRGRTRILQELRSSAAELGVVVVDVVHHN